MTSDTGIRQRHGRGCKQTGRCKCPYEASVYSKRDGKKIRKTFPDRSAAVAWRDDAKGAVRRNKLRAPVPITVAEAFTEWLDLAKQGVIRTRSGDPYKPSAIRAYEASMRLRVLPEFARVKMGEVTRNDLQDLVDRLVASGMSPSAIGVTILPLRAMYKRAISRGDVAVNPTTGLEMPAVRGGRDRIAPPDECLRLLEALPASDRALWATAMYAGLRRGELMALRIEDVDLASGVILVHRGWDAKEGEIETKGRNRRKVPIPAALRDQRAPPAPRVARRSGLRRIASQPVRAEHDHASSHGGVGMDSPSSHQGRERGLDRQRWSAQPDYASRVPPHLRKPDDCRRGQCESPLDLLRAREHLDHAGPVWPPLPRQRRRGRSAAGRVPVSRQRCQCSRQSRASRVLTRSDFIGFGRIESPANPRIARGYRARGRCTTSDRR